MTVELSPLEEYYSLGRAAILKFYIVLKFVESSPFSKLQVLNSCKNVENNLIMSAASKFPIQSTAGAVPVKNEKGKGPFIILYSFIYSLINLMCDIPIHTTICLYR